MNNIKTTVETRGWLEIVEMFESEILNCTDVKNIKQNESAEHIKLEVMARSKASKAIKRVLAKINRIASEEKQEKIVYR